MRLIDADALKETMYHEAFEKDSDMQKWDSGCWIRYKMFEKAINSAPTIDPVKHGRWVTVRVCGYKVDACTNCGDVVEHCEVLKYDFCPWCGARMDGEKGE